MQNSSLFPLSNAIKWIWLTKVISFMIKSVLQTCLTIPSNVIKCKPTTLLQHIRKIRQVTLSSPCLWASFHPLTLLLVVSESKEILLNLNMKFWISAFNAQCSRGIIVAVHVRAVKIYVTAVEVIKKEESRKVSPPPPPMLMYFFAGFFWISPCVWPNSGSWCCLFLTSRISLLCDFPLMSKNMFSMVSISTKKLSPNIWLLWIDTLQLSQSLELNIVNACEVSCSCQGQP